MKEFKIRRAGRLNPHTEAHVNRLSPIRLDLRVAGGQRCAEKARATVEGVPAPCVCIQHCARALPKAPGREIERNLQSEGCRKAVRQQRFTATSTELSNCEVGEGGLGKSRSFPIKDF